MVRLCGRPEWGLGMVESSILVNKEVWAGQDVLFSGMVIGWDFTENYRKQYKSALTTDVPVILSSELVKM